MSMKSLKPVITKIEARAALLMTAFTIGTLATWGFGLSSMLNYAYTPVAFGLAAYLYKRSLRHYFSFLLWLWLLTPEVRRLVDFKTEYHRLSFVQLAPYAATLLTFVIVFKQFARLRHRRWFPFALSLAGVLYGYLVGMFQWGFLASTYDFLTWTLPIMLALALALESVRKPEVLEDFVSTMCVGLLVISIYGIIQFYYLPPWDAFWLRESHYTAAGVAEEQGVRIFGPLNSPGPFAIMLHVGLLYAIAARSKLKLLATGIGLPAFALCMVRSSWGACVLGLVYIFFHARASTRLKMILAILVSGAIAFPLLNVGVVSDKLSTRLNTINSLENDNSFQSRSQFYADSFVASFQEPIGLGLGSTGTSQQLATGVVAVFDSGIMLIPITLGWLGGILYYSGVLWLVFGSLVRLKSKEPMTIVTAAVAWGLFAEMIFAQTMEGFTGTFFWLGAAIQICYQEKDALERYRIVALFQMRRARTRPALNGLEA